MSSENHFDLAEMDAVREDFSRQNDKDKADLILSIACRSYCILLIINSVVSQVFKFISMYGTIYLAT